MPKPTKQRRDKARNACMEAVAILRQHPEFDEFNEEYDLFTNVHQDHYTVTTAHIRFLKSGTHIFRNPPGLEDHDWPELVGQKILEKAAREAAGKVQLKITKNVQIYIASSEKGWVQVGYKFYHHDQKASQ